MTHTMRFIANVRRTLYIMGTGRHHNDVRSMRWTRRAAHFWTRRTGTFV